MFKYGPEKTPYMDTFHVVSPRVNNSTKTVQYLIYYILLIKKNEQNKKISVHFKYLFFVFSLMHFFTIRFIF